MTIVWRCSSHMFKKVCLVKCFFFFSLPGTYRYVPVLRPDTKLDRYTFTMKMGKCDWIFITIYRKWFARHFSSTLSKSSIFIPHHQIVSVCYPPWSRKYRLREPPLYKEIPYRCSSKNMLDTVVPLHQWARWGGPYRTSTLSSRTLSTVRNIDSNRIMV